LKIEIQNISKHFNAHLVFNNISAEIDNLNPIAILGKNGSGKSTLIKIISGIMSPDLGNINYYYNQKPIAKNDIYKYVALTAPYLELIEEFTLQKILSFHLKFVPFLNGLSKNNVIQLLSLENNSNTKIKDYSSGMKQKLKIALSVFYSKPFLIFDEPFVNLDPNAIDWYNNIMLKYLNNRLLIVCSNNIQEVSNIKYRLFIENYK